MRGLVMIAVGALVVCCWLVGMGVEMTDIGLCLCRLCEGGELLDRILSRYGRNHSGKVLRFIRPCCFWWCGHCLVFCGFSYVVLMALPWIMILLIFFHEMFAIMNPSSTCRG